MQSSKPTIFDLQVTCSCGDLRKATRRLSLLYDAVLEPSGLKLSQYQILFHIARASHPPTVTELAKQLILDKSALAHNLKPLEREGFVEQQQDGIDRRSKRVVLTTAGARQMRAAGRLWRKAQGRFESAYGVERSKRLTQAIAGIISDEFLEAFTT